MYRLANYLVKDVEKEIREMVSFNLATMIELILGEPDENGELKDIERVKKFMSKSYYLSPLTENNMTSGNGLLTEKTPWPVIIAKRYSDILAKLKDTKHEYTFDEMGEGLIFEMIQVCCHCNMGYLDEDYAVGKIYDMESYYEHEDIVFVKMGEEKYNNLYYTIEAKIKAGLKKEYGKYLEDIRNNKIQKYKDKNGNIEFNEPFLQAYYLLESEFLDEDSYIEIYADAYMSQICDYCNYLDDGFGDIPSECLTDDLKEISDVDSDTVHEAIELLDCTCPSLISWDDDWTFIFSSLGNKQATDGFLKTVGVIANYTASTYDSLFTGDNDIKKELQY